MAKLTQAIVKRELQAIGMTFRKSCDNEFRIAFAEDAHDSERCAAFVSGIGHEARPSQDTLDECLTQGLVMRLHRDTHGT